MLVGAERALAQPEDIALAVIDRNGVQSHGRQRRAQLPPQRLRGGRLRAGRGCADGRACWERVLWLQDLPHRGLRFRCRFAFRVTAYSRRRREVCLFTCCAATPTGFAGAANPVHKAAPVAPRREPASGALTKCRSAADEKIVLADLDARMTQDCVGGRDMEERVRNDEADEVFETLEFQGAVAGRYFDDPVLGAFERSGRHAPDEIKRACDTRVQLLERLFLVLELRGLHTGEARHAELAA